MKLYRAEIWEDHKCKTVLMASKNVDEALNRAKDMCCFWSVADICGLQEIKEVDGYEIILKKK